jgi:hypothetical protein
MSNRGFWEIADYVKRRLFSRLRRETSSINYLNYEEYRERLGGHSHGALGGVECL